VNALLRAGADKVSMNSAAVRDPEMLSRCADRFGTQCMVVAIDARRIDNAWEVVIDAGKTPTGRDAVAWAVEATASGVGALDGFSDPTWSPDGSLVLVMHGVHSDDGDFIQGGLATIRPDGSELQYVGDGLGAEHQADWSTSQC
jgi:hypothetical protein